MKREEVFAYTEGCINGEPASCAYACPFRLDLRSFLKKSSRGRWSAAAKELVAALPFPKVVSELCPRPCEGACQRSTVLGEEPVAINLIEKYCLGVGEKKERRTYALPPLPQRCAVIGAGPVGLACALYLGRKRYGVTVFDRENGWGGSLRAHPSFGVFDADFAQRLAAEDVEFKFGTEITDLAELNDYDVIFVATGKGGDDFGLLAGWDPELGTTDDPRVFMGGEAAGLSVIDGMAHAFDVSKAIEAYIQSGNPAYGAEKWDRSKCTQYAPHPGEPASPRVVPAGEEYVSEEAQAEAARCMQCDCDRCMSACELLTNYRKKPPRIAIDVAQDGQTRNSVSSACITRQTWSCSQCGRCGAICERGVDVGGLFELSRIDRVGTGSYPAAMHDYYLRELEFSASDARLTRAAPGTEKCGYAFFPGCRLGGANPEYVTRSYEFLLEKLGGVGILLNCCGVPALWAGEDKRFREHIARLRADWEALGGPKLIYACASCRRTLRRFLPEAPLVPLYELLEAEPGERLFPQAAVFDPCAAHGDGELKIAVRALAARAGERVTDYDADGKCCGFGGHMQLANPGLYDEITANRCAETEDPFIVYCVNCADVFKARGKDCAHILDIVFSLGRGAPPTLDEKKENKLRAKGALMKKYWNEDLAESAAEWDAMRLDIGAETVARMERALIPLSDVKETIWRNERAGEGFENAAGEVVCRLVCKVLTYWVKYRKNADVYEVLDVYSHRMRIREDEG